MSSDTFTRTQISGTILLALAAGCVPALQPILLGGLLEEHRLTASQIGQAATMEAVGMAALSAIAGGIFKPTRLRSIALVAAAGLCIANGLTLAADGIGILAARALNGAASGVLLWILVGLITRAANPGRLFAVYVLSQAIVSFFLATIFEAVIMPRFGAAGGYGILMLLGLILIFPIMLIKSEYPTVDIDESRKKPTIRGGIGLLTVFLNFAALFSLWVYLVPIGRYLGYAQKDIALAISSAISFQIMGGLVSFALAGRIDGAVATAISSTISATIVLIILSHPAFWIFLGSICFISFFYTFIAPFHVPLLISADPSNRSAMFVSSAQLTGVACGPLAASFTVYEGGVMSAVIVSACLYVGTLGGAVLSRTRRIRS